MPRGPQKARSGYTMCRVSTAPVATSGNSGLNWKKFSLSTRVSCTSPLRWARRKALHTSSPPNPPPMTTTRCGPPTQITNDSGSTGSRPMRKAPTGTS